MGNQFSSRIGYDIRRILMKKYDVIIIGAGPGGIFLQLTSCQENAQPIHSSF